jgi:autotransporter-associated beta strand protein
MNGTSGNAFIVGNSIYGAYELAGGTVQVNNTDASFRASVRSGGVFYQTGGTFNIVNPLANGNNFQIGGAIYATGGTSSITAPTAATVAITNSGTVTTATQLTIGGTAVWSTTGVINVLGLPVNLIDTGRLSVMSLTGAGNLNFNGGTLRAGTNSTTFLTGLSATTIYSGGATIDTDGKNITVGQNLLAPTGSGLASIPLTSVGSGYIGAPLVTITGGGGTGATAVANYDPTTGLITGITITSPGTGYTSAPTVAFSTPGFTPTVAAVIGTPTIAANATTGGLTKSGTGTLTLSGTNTYGGGTTVNGGSLFINSSAGAGTGGITVNSGVLKVNASIGNAITLTGGTLSGNATLAVDLALNSTAAIISPGNSPGIASFGATQNWTAYTYDWEINNFTGTTGGTDFDKIDITTGGLNLTGGTAYVLNVLSLDGSNASGIVPNFGESSISWSIITTQAGITAFDAGKWTINSGDFATLNGSTGTFSLVLTNADKDLSLVYTPVPEPSGYAAIAGVGMIGFALYRRRRQQKAAVAA